MAGEGSATTIQGNAAAPVREAVRRGSRPRQGTGRTPQAWRRYTASGLPPPGSSEVPAGAAA